ncbi:hypothetical protein SOVF_148470 [Spinacia oleracea]|nr:hypothetical protein SOVF_148470 [Spinacia oleracea]
MEDEKKLKHLPQVLQDLINANFDSTRGAGARDDHPYFCVDCKGRSLREAEVIETCRPKHHRVLRARKCSNVYGFRVKELAPINIVDLRGVDRYSINSEDIVYPRRRNKHNPNSSKSKRCVYCMESLKNPIEDDILFCSIMCKLLCSNDQIEQYESMVQDIQLGLQPFATKKKKKKNKKKKEKKRKLVTENDTQKNKRQNVSDVSKFFEELVTIAEVRVEETDQINNFRKRSRKGVDRIPCRAPMF